MDHHGVRGNYAAPTIDDALSEIETSIEHIRRGRSIGETQTLVFEAATLSLFAADLVRLLRSERLD